MRVRLPVPSNWQDFEVLCHQLWKEIWSDPNAQRNGRAGQQQAGVDIFGLPTYQQGYSGVQCKDRDSRFGSSLTEEDLIAACNNAQSFTPALKVFTLATTAPSDQSIQGRARILNHDSRYPFQVHVWSWDEIESEVSARPLLARRLYGELQHGISNSARMCLSSPRDQFVAFFSRPQITSLIEGKLKEHVIGLCYELCDNAFEHGKATSIDLSFDGMTLSIRDNGVAFNPLIELDSSLASLKSHMGSLVLSTFGAEFPNVALTYDRRDDYNNVGIALGHPIDASNPRRVEISLDISDFFSRSSYERFADSMNIPPGTEEVILNISVPCFVSGAAALICSLRRRIPEATKLIIYYPKDSLFDYLLPHLHDIDVECRER